MHKRILRKVSNDHPSSKLTLKWEIHVSCTRIKEQLKLLTRPRRSYDIPEYTSEPVLFTILCLSHSRNKSRSMYFNGFIKILRGKKNIIICESFQRCLLVLANLGEGFSIDVFGPFLNFVVKLTVHSLFITKCVHILS